MHNLFGNSALNTGYACLMQKLVTQWRQLWSTEPGTTAADAAFGVVTLAPSGTEGGSDIGTMRLAQTASYSYAPNPALPKVFVAQAYDLNDPYHNDSCCERASGRASPDTRPCVRRHTVRVRRFSQGGVSGNARV